MPPNAQRFFFGSVLQAQLVQDVLADERGERERLVLPRDAVQDAAEDRVLPGRGVVVGQHGELFGLVPGQVGGQVLEELVGRLGEAGDLDDLPAGDLDHVRHVVAGQQGRDLLPVRVAVRDVEADGAAEAFVDDVVVGVVAQAGGHRAPQRRHGGHLLAAGQRLGGDGLHHGGRARQETGRDELAAREVRLEPWDLEGDPGRHQALELVRRHGGALGDGFLLGAARDQNARADQAEEPAASRVGCHGSLPSPSGDWPLTISWYSDQTN
jgi:hypothetical protein